MTSELIKCPHCGYKFRMDVKESWNAGKAPMTRGIFDVFKRKPEKSILDVKCSNCGKTFGHEVKV